MTVLVRLRRCRWVLAAALLALAGCDMGPDYHKPDLAPSPAWRDGTTVANWPSTDWWHGFGAPQLDAYMAEAEKTNFDLGAAYARVRQADAQVRIAGAPLLPSLELDAGAARQRVLTGSTGSKSNYSDFQLAPTATYEVDFWGKNRATLQAAKETALASRYDQQVVDLTVMSGVANTYFAIVALQDRLKAAHDNLANGQHVLRGVITEREVGTATALDVAQQQTVVAGLEAAIPPLQQQLVQNTDALAILLGRNPEGVTVPENSLEALAIPAVAPGLPSVLLQRRPDVSEAEAQLVAANANIKAARAQFFPDVNLTAQGGVGSLALSSLFTPAGTIYTLAASLTQPIFEGGRLTGQLEYSKARYDELEQDYRKAVVSAFGGVENALIATQKTAERERDEAVLVAQARRAFEIAQAQYQGGTVTILSVLNTETTLFAAEDTLVTDRLAHMQAMVSLFQALGGGWTDQSLLNGKTAETSLP